MINDLNLSPREFLRAEKILEPDEVSALSDDCERCEGYGCIYCCPLRAVPPAADEMPYFPPMLAGER